MNTTLQNVVTERRWGALEENLGPDVMRYMHDDEVFEVMVNPDGRLWLDTFHDGFVDTGIILLEQNTKRIIYAVADLSGQVIDVQHDPSLQADIPKSRLFANCRFQAELPPLVTGPSFNIRKHSREVYTLDDYVKQGTMTPLQRDVILQAVHDGRNIIAAGGTKSGKTTLLNAILHEISKLGQRIITIEDTKELKCTAENQVGFVTMEHVDMDALLRKTLRKSPNRIVVGEVRGKEALTLIHAWSTGHRGGCASVHSESAIETLYRLEEMVSQASVTPQQAAIARAIDVVVYLRYRAMQRRIEEILFVKDYDKAQDKYIVLSFRER